MDEGSRFHLVGNVLWLDLVNTEARDRGRPVDLLGGFDDLVDWLRAAGALDARAAREARSRAGGTAGAARALGLARELRRRLREMAERMAQGRPVPDASIEAVNRVLALRPAWREVVREGDRFVTRAQGRTPPPASHLVVPVAESAAEWLEHGAHGLIRKCGNPDCVLYFYDITKNHRRRWCSMDGCGSRLKSAAYYRRARAARDAGTP